jgi:phage terminase small subunit
MSFIDYIPDAATINGTSNANAVESAEFAEALAKLPPRQARFVKEYVIVGIGAEAVRRAGYKTAEASNRAYKLMKIPAVAAAIEAGRRDVASNARYDANAAMAELNSTIEYSKTQKNSMAVVKAVELKMKLCGLLIDRLEITEKPNITGALIEAKRRTQRLPPSDENAILDVESTLPFKRDIVDPFGD